MRTPILTTDRLIIESFTLDDLDLLSILLADKEVHRFFPKTLSYEESKVFLNTIISRYHSEGTCFWGVFLKPTTTFIGMCGILRHNIDAAPVHEVAYRFLPAYWGNGYATEAVVGCIEYAQKKMQLSEIISLIRPINRPSINVALRCGLIFEREIFFHGLIHGVYKKQL